MTEEKRGINQTVVTFALVAVILVNLVVTAFLWNAYEGTQREQQQMLTLWQDLLTRVQSTAKYVAVGNISLIFVPYLETQVVSGTTITYLVGFVTISQLTNIVARPITLNVFFTPNVTAPEYGNVTYEYTDVQTLEIPPELDEVLMPWGAFPVTLEGFRSGDEIIWDMKVEAVVTWIGTEVTRISVDVTYKFTVI